MLLVFDANIKTLKCPVRGFLFQSVYCRMKGVYLIKDQMDFYILKGYAS